MRDRDAKTQRRKNHNKQRDLANRKKQTHTKNEQADRQAEERSRDGKKINQTRLSYRKKSFLFLFFSTARKKEGKDDKGEEERWRVTETE